MVRSFLFCFFSQNIFCSLNCVKYKSTVFLTFERDLIHDSFLLSESSRSGFPLFGDEDCGFDFDLTLVQHPTARTSAYGIRSPWAWDLISLTAAHRDRSYLHMILWAARRFSASQFISSTIWTSRCMLFTFQENALEVAATQFQKLSDPQPLS